MADKREFDGVISDVVDLVETARRASARSVNAILTSTYWAIGRRIVEAEQRGRRRAGYGEELLERLGAALTLRFGRGFTARGLRKMRAFYAAYRDGSLALEQGLTRGVKIWPTLSAESAGRRESSARLPSFPLPWSHYVRLVGLAKEARRFYEAQALRGGWTERQLKRQVETEFYERTLQSRGAPRAASSGDELSAEEEIRDPYILEFLGLKDQYSESDIEDALIRQVESFLLELGGDFTFAGRQWRCRIGDEWYRIDLVLFHRRLRCLVIIDLKLNGFTPADVGQMNFYLNYAREQWTLPDENPPVGLILSAKQNAAVARYAFEGVANTIVAARYLTALPEEHRLVDELNKTRQRIESLRPKPKK